MAAGFRHPAVLVPRRLLSEFGQTELDHVLLHELSHLARRDDWSNLVARVVSAAVWFNPAARWALRRIERSDFDDVATVDANYMRRTDAEIFAKPAGSGR